MEVLSSTLQQLMSTFQAWCSCVRKDVIIPLFCGGDRFVQEQGTLSVIITVASPSGVLQPSEQLTSTLKVALGDVVASFDLQIQSILRYGEPTNIIWFFS